MRSYLIYVSSYTEYVTNQELRRRPPTEIALLSLVPLFYFFRLRVIPYCRTDNFLSESLTSSVEHGLLYGYTKNVPSTQYTVNARALQEIFTSSADATVSTGEFPRLPTFRFVDGFQQSHLYLKNNRAPRLLVSFNNHARITRILVLVLP